jgi:hypothetical protein
VLPPRRRSEAEEGTSAGLLVGLHYSAVVGSITETTSETLFAGNATMEFVRFRNMTQLFDLAQNIRLPWAHNFYVSNNSWVGALEIGAHPLRFSVCC